jgi:tRNA1Val (adenine37-N6)-methyltransferase
MPFHFKKFTVEDTHSTQRVGTDAMLLGAWAEPSPAGRILDIGTGCGVLALMMAQKSSAIIDAIDLDENSVSEATINFTNSAWSERIFPHLTALQQFKSIKGNYDYIISNPPFFSNALPSPDKRRNFARHNDLLPASDLVHYIGLLLKPDGRFSIILPYNESAVFVDLCGANALYPARRTIVHTTPEARPKRILMEFHRNSSSQPIEKKLIITDSRGKFSHEYLSLTTAFHNF